MIREEDRPPYHDEHTRKLFDISDALGRRANAEILNLNALSRRLQSVMTRCRDSDESVTELLHRTKEELAAEYERKNRGEATESGG